MQLRYIILCEYASIQPNGIFNVIGGGIRILSGPKLPVVFSASMVLVFECAMDEGVLELNIQLRDADGRKLYNLKQPIRLKSQTKVHTSVIRFERLKIDKVGDYSFEIFISGK